jgi:alpha-pyrone synthase
MKISNSAPGMAPVFINAIGTASPSHDIHAAFIAWAEKQIRDPREQKLFARMAERSGIHHRWSVLPPTAQGGSPIAPGGFYDVHPLPPTSTRMQSYAHYAPHLALQAIDDLAQKAQLGAISHVVVASCTGFVAPGIDQIIARTLGLSPFVERLLIGFMGCYAAVTALRSARHILRSNPSARVLLVCVELSTLHLQPDTELEPLLAMLQFSDGAAACLITSDAGGLELGAGRSLALPDSEDLIRWDIGDMGFAMHLSGQVPARLQAVLNETGAHAILSDDAHNAQPIEHFAVHAGGRSILDAVEKGFGLNGSALSSSRRILENYGNMSSATLLFVLADMLQAGVKGRGLALAFGPGLAAEAIGFTA